MSASVDQRTKGQSNQGSNGPGKDHDKKEFDGYLAQTQGHYGAPMSSPNISETAYMPNYNYMSYPSYVSGPTGMNDASSWSNGGDPMSFLGGYGQMNNEYMAGNGMFGGFGYQPGFGSWEFSGGDYNAWGPSSNQSGRKDDRGYAEGYYQGMPQTADAYAAMSNGDAGPERELKTMDHGFKSMSISNDRDSGRDHRGNVNDGHQSSRSAGSGSSAPPKKTWASIASQPAKQQSGMPNRSIPRAPVLPNKMDIGTWDSRGASKGSQPSRQNWGGNRGGGRQVVPGPYSASGQSNHVASSNLGRDSNGSPSATTNGSASHPVLDRLKSANMYNPKDFNLNPKGCRFFIIKSYSEDDIHRSIKYSIWCSTEHGNKRLDAAYREREGKGPVYLFYSVNGSGHFCGMAQMMSPLDYNTTSSVWAQDKWKGKMEVKWIYVKDVPNSQLRHIRLENNENKPVTNSRDTQEVPPEKGKQVLKIMNSYKHSTSIFDDFIHYERRQEETPSQDYSKQNDSRREGRGNHE